MQETAEEDEAEGGVLGEGEAQEESQEQSGEHAHEADDMLDPAFADPEQELIDILQENGCLVAP